MKRVGLFIGIDKYSNGISSLKCSCEDARELSYYFARQQFEVALLDNEKASCVDIVQKTMEMTKNLGTDDLFVFYFAGHGRQAGEEHYLVGPDGFPDDTLCRIGSVAVNELLAASRGRGVNRLFILDCCRTHIVPGRGESYSCPGSRDISLNRALQANVNNGGLPSLIINSCSEGQQAFEREDRRHGAFTLALLETLKDKQCPCSDFSSMLKRVNDEISKLIPQGRKQNIHAAGNIFDWDKVPLFQSWENKEEKKSEASEVGRPAEERVNKAGEKVTQRESLVQGCDYSLELVGSRPIDMIWVEPGAFQMGSPEGEPGRYDDEWRHSVRLTKGYWLGKYEVTYGQWKAVMGTTLRDQVRMALEDDTVYSNLGDKTLRDCWGMKKGDDPDRMIGPEGDDIPMHYVSWYDAKEFCRRMNKCERAAGRLPAGYEYSLPTEAQWEFACRAGTDSALYSGNISIIGMNNAPALDAIAWYGGNSSVGFTGRGWDTANWQEKQYPGGIAGPRDVGGKKENRWGFFDMIGNMFEWCEDWYGAYTGDAIDPTGPANGSYRAIRGGCWFNCARLCRSAYRGSVDPKYRVIRLGFRLALYPVH